MRLTSRRVPWRLFALSFFFLLLGFFIGYMVGAGLSESLVEYLKKFYGGAFNVPLPMLTLLIFINNFVKSFAAMLLGVAIGIPSILFIFTNGLVLGVLGYAIIKDYGLWFFLAGILPHGILEIPAVVLSVALGIRLGMAVVRRIRHVEVSMAETLQKCIESYFRIVLPLLAIAAVVESYVTPLIIEFAV
jgi:stage II sporulation protein M